MKLYEILYELPASAGLKPKEAYAYVAANGVEEAIEKSNRSRMIPSAYEVKQIIARGEVSLVVPDTLYVDGFGWLGTLFR